MVDGDPFQGQSQEHDASGMSNGQGGFGIGAEIQFFYRRLLWFVGFYDPAKIREDRYQPYFQRKTAFSNDAVIGQGFGGAACGINDRPPGPLDSRINS